MWGKLGPCRLTLVPIISALSNNLKATRSLLVRVYKSTLFTCFDLQNMEDDRAHANLSDAISVELEAPAAETTKQPKKRFIGRRAAAERAAKNADQNSTIEDSGSIQGKSVAPRSETAVY